MGQATRRAIEATKLARFDFAGPEFYLSAVTREQWARSPATRSCEACRKATTATPGEAVGACADHFNEKRAPARICRATIAHIIGAAFPQGMNGQDRRSWAVWLEHLDDEGEDQVDLPFVHIEWLRRHVQNVELRTQPGFAQYHEALADYLAAVPSLDSQSPPA